MMPYISEELWQRLPFSDGLPCDSICIAQFPESFEINVSQNEIEEFETINLILNQVRSLRESVSIPKKEWPILSIFPKNETYRVLLTEQSGYFKKLCGIGEVNILASDEQPAGTLKRIVAENAIYLHIKGLIDAKQAAAKLQKDLNEKLGYQKDYESKVGNPDLPEQVRLDT